ncbi:hypothetical protein [Bdellovibrio bacteriovorus]|uniref:hypothetical protein n=1 Tax=Bdellovibrio TaxID=958 RepID=UPI0035A85509
MDLYKRAFKINPKSSLIDWLNDYHKSKNPDSSEKTPWTLQSANAEPFVFLIDYELDLEIEETLQDKEVQIILKMAYDTYLESYYATEDIFPPFSLEQFKKWFDLEVFGGVFDLS